MVRVERGVELRAARRIGDIVVTPRAAANDAKNPNKLKSGVFHFTTGKDTPPRLVSFFSLSPAICTGYSTIKQSPTNSNRVYHVV